MKKLIGELAAYRYLLYMFTVKELKIRYKQSVMGFAWALLMPVLIVTAGLFVQKSFSIMSGRPLALKDVCSVAVRAIPWAFFIGCLRFGTNSLTSNGNLITKIYFPRELCPLAAVLAQLVDLSLAVTVLTVVLAAAGIGVSLHLAWVPLLLATLVLFTGGVTLLLSCANLFYRDVKYLVEVLLTFGIFFTPVFYEARMLGDWAPLLLLNPVGSILEGLSAAVVYQRSPDPFWVAYAVTSSVATVLVAVAVFDRAEPAFAENA